MLKTARLNIGKRHKNHPKTIQLFPFFLSFQSIPRLRKSKGREARVQTKGAQKTARIGRRGGRPVGWPWQGRNWHFGAFLQLLWAGFHVARRRSLQHTLPFVGDPYWVWDCRETHGYSAFSQKLVLGGGDGACWGLSGEGPV